jgi:hypothetical protein
MQLFDAQDVFINPLNWREITRERALLLCEFDPVVAVYLASGHKKADRVEIATVLMSFGSAFQAPGTKFYQRFELSGLTAAQQASKQKLIAAQDAARAKPAFQPSAGVTHCNQATVFIANAVGAPTSAFSGELANNAAADLAKSSQYKTATVDEVQTIANNGGLAIATWINPAGHGHMATVRPLGVTGDNPVNGRGPLLNNIGTTVKVQYANWVFPKSANVIYYTPK